MVNIYGWVLNFRKWNVTQYVLLDIPCTTGNRWCNWEDSQAEPGLYVRGWIGSDLAHVVPTADLAGFNLYISRLHISPSLSWLTCMTKNGLIPPGCHLRSSWTSHLATQTNHQMIESGFHKKDFWPATTVYNAPPLFKMDARTWLLQSYLFFHPESCRNNIMAKSKMIWTFGDKTEKVPPTQLKGVLS